MGSAVFVSKLDQYLWRTGQNVGQYFRDVGQNVADDFRSDPLRTAGQFGNLLGTASYLYDRYRDRYGTRQYSGNYNFPDVSWKRFRSPWSYRKRGIFRRPGRYNYRQRRRFFGPKKQFSYRGKWKKNR